MKYLRSLAAWIVWDCPFPLPVKWGPWLFGFSIGCKGKCISSKEM